MPAHRLRVPFCGLPCSEVTIGGDGVEATHATGGCPVCRAAVRAMATGVTADAAAPEAFSSPLVDGRPASYGEALDAAAALLSRARSPLIYGLSRSPIGAARAAARLARAVSGAIDVEDGDLLAADDEAFQAFGLAAATFGEIRSRADVVLLWRVDPRATHPRLLPEAATLILVPRGGAAAAAPPDGGRVLPVAPGGDLAAILTLRAFIAGAAPRPAEAQGVPTADLRAAAEAIRKARYAAILWDAATTAGPLGPAIASAIALLARDLNVGGRAAARPLGAGGNVAGAVGALASILGVPRAAGLHGGAARRAEETFAGAAMMAAGGADAVLLVGARRLPGAGAGRGGSDPDLIVVGQALPEGCPASRVVLPAAAPGWDGGGLYLRADGVPVPVRPDHPSSRLQEEAILAGLLDRLASGENRGGVLRRTGQDT